MNSIAIIPARGGSKRIPRKNIKEFLGKPIIAYSIEAALNSGLFDEVMVSTDDEEIANISRKYGAKVPFMRSKVNANDFAGLAEVVIEVLNQYNDVSIEFDRVCCIMATSPFITPALLKDSLHAGGDFCYPVVPVVKYSYPIQRSFVIVDGLGEMAWPENYDKRSQDFPPAFHDCGSFYWLSVSALLAEKKIYSTKFIPFEIPETDTQDIDTEEDWLIAELKFKLRLL